MSTEPTGPGRAELEELVGRAVAERLEPVRAELSSITRALAVLAERANQVEPLVVRLVEGVDDLAREAGRVEVMAQGHVGEARAVEDRVAAMFAQVAERAESATDRSRGRIAEGQVALAARFDTILAEVVGALSATTERLEARLAEHASELKAAGGHQNGALLDALNRSSQRLGDGLAELRADPRVDAILVEQVAARDAQLEALAALAGKVDEVGPKVANALLAEVQRATRSANAAEEAVARLNPGALKSVLREAVDAAGEIQAAARGVDDNALGLAGSAMEELRASQASLREAIQDGAHKAELASSDIRSLRDRLTPHLAALAEATGRRAEADQAGFDAVLARIDRLLAEHQP